MASPTAVLLSPPEWGPQRRERPLELRVARGPAADVTAGAVLLVVWVLLWCVFVAGVVERAAHLDAGAPSGEIRSAVGLITSSGGS